MTIMTTRDRVQRFLSFITKQPSGIIALCAIGVITDRLVVSHIRFLMTPELGMHFCTKSYAPCQAITIP